MSTKYIDLHCHPSTKPFLKKQSGLGRPSLWETINYNLILWFDELFAKDILDSQSSLEQLENSNGGYHTIIAPVISMERELAVYTKFPLAIKLMLPFPKQITSSYFKTLQSRDFPYAQSTEQEIDFVKNTENVNLLSYSNKQLVNDQINVVLAIEGGHCLYSSAKLEDSDEQVITQLKKILQNHRVFYLTLCHLAPSPISNHCFAMKGVAKKNLHHFYPIKAMGISPVGFKIIDHCNQQSKKTIIDTKHMSLFSRMQYYKYLKEKKYDMPVISTHSGSNGMSVTQWKRQILAKSEEWLRTTIDGKTVVSMPIERPDGIKLRNIQTKFNPATINLFDEDIEAVVRSGGLIGVSFDERILGRGTKKNYLEVILEDELRELLSISTESAEAVDTQKFNKKVNFYDVNMKQPTLNPKEISKDKLKVANSFKQKTADALYFLNNLLYMVEVANRTVIIEKIDADPWSFFALGSDFDGVIDAIDCCKTANKMVDFEELLFQLMVEYITIEAKHAAYAIDPNNAYSSLRSKLEKLCFSNARQFIEKYI